MMEMASKSTQTPTTVLIRRSEKHTVEIRLEVSGYPDIDDQEAIQTRTRVITPDVVAINYESLTNTGGPHWSVTVRVYGRQPGRLLNGWADYRQRQGSEWCPEWLMDLVTRYLPPRGDEIEVFGDPGVPVVHSHVGAPCSRCGSMDIHTVDQCARDTATKALRDGER